MTIITDPPKEQTTTANKSTRGEKMNPQSNMLKPISEFLLHLILMEILVCYLTWLIFGIDVVIYPATAYVLTMIVAIPVAAAQKEKE